MEDPFALLNPGSTRSLLAELGHDPNKKLGQNFLVDANIVRKSLDLAVVSSTDTVVEIGPGLGTLTRALLRTGATIHAIERDKRLFQFLSTHLVPHSESFHLTEGDAVADPIAGLKNKASFKVVANLPYAITSPWMDALLAGPLPDSMTLMLQEEAADRLTAAQGSKAVGALSVDVALAYEKTALHRVPAQCFYPPPKVGSVLLHLQRHEQPRSLKSATKQFIRFAFTQRRKQIGSLARKYDIKDIEGMLISANIDLQQRPESISVEQWTSFDDKISHKADLKL